MLNKSYIKKIKHGGFRSFIKKADELGVDIKILSSAPLLMKLSYKNSVVFAHKGKLPIMRRMGNFTRNKQITKFLLESIGIRTPKGIVAKSYKEALPLIKKARLAYPLIVKPLDGSLARGVSWNIRSLPELKKAVGFFEKTKSTQKSQLLVEEMYIGDEFRVLVFNGEILSCVKKVPATIVGDGKLTIKELVKTFDKTRTRGFEIKLDKIALQTISQNNFNLQSVLPANYILKLRNNLNMSDGGRSIECTEEMSKYLKNICIKAVTTVGLTYGGLDLMTKNLSTKKNDYVILEINPNPFYNMHEKPLVEGVGVDVSNKILSYLFPGLK
jgi:cyanophycin synthetase